MSREIEQIEKMTHEELVRHYRFAPVGDPLLSGVNYDYFMQRLNSYGGITPEISKKVGWDE